MDSIKKYFFMIFSMLLVGNLISAQSNEWEWIKTFGGAKADEIYSSCVDKSGNIYIAGYFQGEINIDGKHLKSNGDTDALIAKFDKFGSLCWAKQVGGDYSENLIITEYAKKINVDHEGNIIVAGIFAWNATIDNTILKGAGNNDIFIIKYSPDGLLLWDKSFGSFSHDNLFDMDIDDNGGIYITGIVNGPIQSEIDNAQGIESLQGSSAFIAKLESMGSLSWLKRNQGVSDNSFISIDKNNNIYYGINYSSGITINDKRIEPEGRCDFIIQQLNTKGETIWQKKYNSKFQDALSSLMD
jgi:hypothetical protein